MGLSLFGGAASATEAPPTPAFQRVTPAGERFSLEFPAAPTCEPSSELPTCGYEDPTLGYIMQASSQKIELSGPPTEFLQKQLAENAEAGGFQIKHQELTHVGSFLALDYRFESIDGSAYQTVGQLVLMDTQLITLEVGGTTLPSEDMSQHFVSSLRVEEPSAKPPLPEPPDPPPPLPDPLPEPSPLPPSIIDQVRAALLGRGVLQYLTVHESPFQEGMPRGFSVGTVRRTTLRKRDKTRDAFVITETGHGQEGRFENRYWIDAKTLLPYRWMRRSADDSMKWELVEGSLRGETKGAGAAKFDLPLGHAPFLFPGAPLELVLSTLPLAPGFKGSVRVLDLEGLARGKPFSTWKLSVPFAGPIQGLAGLKQQVDGYELELVEHTEDKEARRILLWIEREGARRVLQVEAPLPSSRGGGRSVQALQALEGDATQ